MTLNLFRWLREQVAATRTELEQLDESLQSSAGRVEELRETMRQPLVLHWEFQFKTIEETSTPEPSSPVATPPAKVYVTLPTHGFIYYENTRDGFGWITRRSLSEPYDCFYCDGKRKASATRGSMAHARAWMEQF